MDAAEEEEEKLKQQQLQYNSQQYPPYHYLAARGGFPGMGMGMGGMGPVAMMGGGGFLGQVGVGMAPGMGGMAPGMGAMPAGVTAPAAAAAAAVTPATEAAEDEMPDFAALVEQARKIAELARAAAPAPDPASDRRKLLAADARWGAGISPDGRKYFFDRSSGSTQWATPSEVQGAGTLHLVLGEPLLHPALPAPWRELKDPAGRKYYWDVSAGVTQWTRPVPSDILVGRILGTHRGDGDPMPADEGEGAGAGAGGGVAVQSSQGEIEKETSST